MLRTVVRGGELRLPSTDIGPDRRVERPLPWVAGADSGAAAAVDRLAGQLKKQGKARENGRKCPI
jgi:hypothetical protein